MLQIMLRFGLMIGLGLVTAGRLAGQAVPFRGGSAATSVQLPTFNFFTISTSVEVPDSGEGFLGGTSSSAAGSSQRGIPGLGFAPFNNRAIASTGHGGSMSVRATIHDFDAMDKALLGKDFYEKLAKDAASRSPQSSPTVLATDSAGGSSLADIRRQQAAEDAAAAQQVQAIIDQGRAYEAAGKPGLAKIQYSIAARRATGALRQQALAELQRLNASSQSASAGRPVSETSP